MKMLKTLVITAVACFSASAFAYPMTTVYAGSAKYSSATFKANDGEQGSLANLTVNPTTKVLTIVMDNSFIRTISFYDSKGQTICSLPVGVRLTPNILVNLVHTPTCPYQLTN